MYRGLQRCLSAPWKQGSAVLILKSTRETKRRLRGASPFPAPVQLPAMVAGVAQRLSPEDFGRHHLKAYPALAVVRNTGTRRARGADIGAFHHHAQRMLVVSAQPEVDFIVHLPALVIDCTDDQPVSLPSEVAKVPIQCSHQRRQRQRPAVAVEAEGPRDLPMIEYPSILPQGVEIKRFAVLRAERHAMRGELNFDAQCQGWEAGRRSDGEFEGRPAHMRKIVALAAHLDETLPDAVHPPHDTVAPLPTRIMPFPPLFRRQQLRQALQHPQQAWRPA